MDDGDGMDRKSQIIEIVKRLDRDQLLRLSRYLDQLTDRPENQAPDPEPDQKDR